MFKCVRVGTTHVYCLVIGLLEIIIILVYLLSYYLTVISIVPDTLN